MPTTADINYIEDKNGNVFFPVTHVGAVIDDDQTPLNVTLEEKVSSSSYDNIVSMSKTDFDALATKDGRTMYIVDDPNGGATTVGWRLIASGTVSQDALWIYITKDSNNNDFELSEIKVYAKVRGNTSGYTGWFQIAVGSTDSAYQTSGKIFDQFAADTTNDTYYTVLWNYYKHGSMVFPGDCYRSWNNSSVKNSLCANQVQYLEESTGSSFTGNISKIWLQGYNTGGVGAGTEYWIWGIDA